MSVTSANTDDLRAYLDAGLVVRNEVIAAVNALVPLANRVSAACAQAGATMPGLQGMTAVLAQWHSTERYVAVVRETVLEADRLNSDPRSTDALIAARLREQGLDTPPGPVTVEAMQMVGLPPTSGFVDDPICAANGNFVHGDEDMAFPGFARSLGVRRLYNSVASSIGGVFGPGWSSVVDVRLTAGDGSLVRVRLDDGAHAVFRRDAEGGYLRDARRPLSLERTDEGWSMSSGPTRAWTFAEDGALIGWRDGVAEVVVEQSVGTFVLSERATGRSVRYELRHDRVERVVASDGRRCRYRYEGGHLVEAQRAFGAVHYGLDDGRVASVTDADGVVACANVYDDLGRVVRQRNEHGRETTYHYGDLGVTTVTDADGGPRNVLVHDRRGNLTAMLDGTGRAMRLEYDDENRVVRRVDRLGTATRYAYDAMGNLTEREDADGRSHRWAWDDADRLINETDRAGATTRYEYEGRHRSPSVIEQHDGTRVQSTYDDRDLPLTVTDADGVTATFEWDGDGQLVAMVDGLGGRTEIANDAKGNAVKATNAAGVFTRLTVDKAGRVVAVATADGTERFAYTEAGRVLSGSLLGGARFDATYGGGGELRGLSDASGASASFEHDRFGNVTAVSAPDGAVYRQEFDPVGRLTAVVDPTGSRTTSEHDAEGRAVATIDPTGRRWQREVDAWGRTIGMTRPDGAVTRRTYHPNGELASITLPDGSSWSQEVDLHGRVVAITDPLGGRTEMGYTAAGRLESLRRPSGALTQARFDAAGRVVEVVGPDGGIAELERRADGRVVAVRDVAAGRHSAVAYDESGRVTTATTDLAEHVVDWVEGRVAGVGIGSAQHAVFQYDPRGLLARATDPAGVTSDFVHDPRGRLTEMITGGLSRSLAYDEAGRLAAMTDHDGATTRLGRDGAGRPTEVTLPDGRAVFHHYDANGALVRSVAADGEELGRWEFDLVGQVVAATATHRTAVERDQLGRPVVVRTGSDDVRYTWDRDGWLERLEWRTGEGVSVERTPGGVPIGFALPDGTSIPAPDLDDAAVARDSGGRVMADVEGRSFGYDRAGRLSECAFPDGTRVRYEYGLDGHLVREHVGDVVTTYDYGPGGALRLRQQGEATSEFAYDVRGRRTSEKRSDGTTVRYRWDDFDRLRAVDRTAPGGTERTQVIEYDGFGQPVVVDGQRVRWDTGWSGRPLAIGGDYYLWHGKAYRPVAGEAEWSIGRVDDPWGEDGKSGVRIGYTGALTLDSLVFLGARVYDTRTRCFLSRDPLAPVPGTVDAADPYCYARHDPVNYVDPTGGRPLSDEEYGAIRASLEKGTFEKAWDAIRDDPWGTVFMVGVVAAGVGLLFVPGGQAIGAGILIGAAMTAGVGLATGTFNPRSVAIGGAVGGVTGGVGAQASMATTVVTGAASSAAGDVADQVFVRGRGLDEVNLTEVATAGITGGITAGAAKAIFGRVAKPAIGSPAKPAVGSPTKPAVGSPAKPAVDIPAPVVTRSAAFADTDLLIQAQRGHAGALAEIRAGPTYVTPNQFNEFVAGGAGRRAFLEAEAIEVFTGPSAGQVASEKAFQKTFQSIAGAQGRGDAALAAFARQTGHEAITMDARLVNFIEKTLRDPAIPIRRIPR